MKHIAPSIPNRKHRRATAAIERRAGTVTATVELPAGAVTMTAPPPARVSQHTVEAHLGLKRRAYLESLPAYEASGGDVIRAGRTRMVEPEAYLTWLARREAVEADPEETSDEDLAAELGLRMVGGDR